MSPELERLMGQAVVNPIFRQELFTDPAKVMKSFRLSSGEQQHVEQAITDARKSGKTAPNSSDTALSSIW